MSSPNLCCCFSLRTGGLILALLDIIIGIYTVGFSILALGVGFAFPHIMTMMQSNETGILDPSAVDHVAVSSLMSIVLYIFAALLLLDGIVTIAWGSILVHAIRKESENLMKIWMIFRIMSLILEVSVSFILYTYSFSPFEFLEDIFSFIISMWLITIVHYIRMDLTGKYKNLGKDNSTFNSI